MWPSSATRMATTHRSQAHLERALAARQSARAVGRTRRAVVVLRVQKQGGQGESGVIVAVDRFHPQP